jgi:hypothetical protein
MKQRAWDNPWRLMLVVNVIAMLGVLWHKIGLPPYVPYIHLLVDYQYGFIKRGLIGAAVALFTDKVPVWLVFALAGTVWLVTLGLFIELFRRTFGFDERELPLFVFTAGSPFFFKNFMFTLGHFDIFGCLFAICLLLVPARNVLFVVLAALCAVTLLLIHHIHALMYVPTIAVIVVLRHYLVLGFKWQNSAIGLVAISLLAGVFVITQFWGTVPLSEAEFIAHLRTRMVDPSRSDLLIFSYIWYQPLSKEIADTWQRLPSNLLGMPVFALLLWLHLPLWRYLTRTIGTLREHWHRRVVIAGLIGISLGYLLMFAIVFDYSRWVSNWAVCMMLMLHAIKTLPAEREIAPIPSGGATRRFGLAVTLIPRVGIVRPF